MNKNISVEIPLEGLAEGLKNALEDIPGGASISVNKQVAGYYEDHYTYSLVFTWTEEL